MTEEEQKQLGKTLWAIRRRPSPCSDKGIGRGQNPGQSTGSAP